MGAGKLSSGILSDLTGDLPILEIPIYISNRTTQRIIRTNPLSRLNKNHRFSKAVATVKVFFLGYVPLNC